MPIKYGDFMSDAQEQDLLAEGIKKKRGK